MTFKHKLSAAFCCLALAGALPAQAGLLVDSMFSNGITVNEYSEAEGGFFNWYQISNASSHLLSGFAVSTAGVDTFTAFDTWADGSTLYRDDPTTARLDVVSIFTWAWDTQFIAREQWHSSQGAVFGSFEQVFGADDSITGANWYQFNAERFFAATDYPQYLASVYDYPFIRSGETLGDSDNSPFQFYGTPASEFIAFDQHFNLVAQSAAAQGNGGAAAIAEPPMLPVALSGLMLALFAANRRRA